MFINSFFDDNAPYIILILLIIILLIFSIKIVSQQEEIIIERLGKCHKILSAGLHFIIPLFDRVAYKQSLKEEAIEVKNQTGISNDNVLLQIDSVLYVKIVDSKKASYGVIDAYYAILQLAKTSMRSEIGKINLEKIFAERENLNALIVAAINTSTEKWGIKCIRHEIKNINPPKSVLNAMELQVAADRQKRATILESEGYRESQINKAEAEKQKVILQSEAAYTDKINRAKGEYEAIILVAKANYESIKIVSNSLKDKLGEKSATMKLAQQYIESFSNIAKQTNSVIIPNNLSDISGVIAQASSIYNNINKKSVVIDKE